MNDFIILELPLFRDPAYNYHYTIDRVSYNFRFYYNTLMESWIYDVRFSDGTPIVLGRRLTPNAPLTDRYAMPWEGVLVLVPIGKNRRETTSNPFEIYKYYKLLYIREKTPDEKVSEG